MDPREPADLAADRTDLRKLAAVRPTALAEHILTEGLLFQVRECLSGRAAFLGVIFRIALDNLFLQGVDRGITRKFVLACRIESLTQSVAKILLDLGNDGLVDHLRDEFALRVPEGLSEFLLPEAEPLDLFVCP